MKGMIAGLCPKMNYKQHQCFFSPELNKIMLDRSVLMYNVKRKEVIKKINEFGFIWGGNEAFDRTLMDSPTGRV